MKQIKRMSVKLPETGSNRQSNASFRFALMGNPNCGKTTLFNRLTGSHQYVGNWPGVTVEKKEGTIKNTSVTVVDLPGIYSLSPYSPEETVARNCLLEGSVDLVLAIADATNLERNLYLTTQLLEWDYPIVLALNMVDLLKKRGETIDIPFLEKYLGIPVVPISANHGTGIENLLAVCFQEAGKPGRKRKNSFYSMPLEKAIQEAEKELSQKDLRGGTRWAAIKCLEEDPLLSLSQKQKDRFSMLRQAVALPPNMDFPMLIADQRYRWIEQVYRQAVHHEKSRDKWNWTEKIDRVLTHRIWALPFFVFCLGLIFWITFGPPGTFLKDKMEWIIQQWAGWLAHCLTGLGVSEWIHSLLIDGILHGVGAVVSFAPQILLLFLLLSLLEDSGYMARAAFVMDRPLRRIGLSGKACVPMLMGFGCTVPAVLGTRTLESPKDRRLTIFITPFFSCSAKMPVYALFAAVFFPEHQALVIFSLYLLGVVMAIASAAFFQRSMGKGSTATFVMELPPYRLPTPQSIGVHVWQRLKDFFLRAGTLIFAASVVIWFLHSFDGRLHLTFRPEESILAAFGDALAPVFTWCGFADWRASVSLLSGLVAKESVVSTLSVLSAGTGTALTQIFSPLSAYCFLVFVLLYPPCVASQSAIWKEMGSFVWSLISLGYQLAVAWFVSAFLFQMGTLWGHLFF